jgi:hypothetical protein
MKKPADRCGPRADFFDDGFMLVICPTAQAFYQRLIYLESPSPVKE